MNNEKERRIDLSPLAGFVEDVKSSDTGSELVAKQNARNRVERVRDEIDALRAQGDRGEWTPVTHCVVCGDEWLWGVKDNKNFICPKHPNHS